MKKLIIILSFCSCFFTLKAENCQCNYIESGYYQDVYKADLELYKGNHEKAYQYLQSAEQKCKMINMLMYYEIDKYIPLLLEYNELQKAVHYINFLISEQGYQLENFEKLPHFEKLKTLNNWGDIYQSLAEAEKTFVSDTALALEFQAMQEKDQRYRGSPNYFDNFAEYGVLQKTLDDSNYNEIMSIIETKGFPLLSNMKLNMQHRGMIASATTLILVHAATDSTKLVALDSVVLAHVAKGNWLPDFYGSMIDRNMLQYGKPYIFGTYANAQTPEQIYNFENLDKRRMSVGLPPMSVAKERIELINEVMKDWTEIE